MTNVATQLPGGSVWVAAARLAPLDAYGNLIPGSNALITDQIVKATFTPVNEPGDMVTIKNATGNISVAAILGDIPKWFTISFEIAVPDPQIEAALCGGVVLNDTSEALGLVTGLTATAQATLGTLTAGVYAYQVSQYNAYGETLPSTEVTATTTGSTGAVVLTGMTNAAGALGNVFYGRTAGSIRQIGTLVNCGTQATSAASGTGTVTSLSVTALTAPLSVGYTFQISGDTNTTKIVFTVTAGASIGATVVSVSASQSVSTTIVAASFVPCFVDNGSAVPSNAPNTTDLSAGPGNAIGYQSAALLSVPNPSGVSIEIFQRRITKGKQDPIYPFWRWVFPQCCNFVQTPSDYTNANRATIFTGNAFQNPNWGSGPANDWQFDSSKIVQRAMCGREIVPTPGVVPVAVAY